MFTGEYNHSLDEKGRIIIPAKFREMIGNELVLARGLDGCLFGFSKDEWFKLLDKLDNLSFVKHDVRNFNRFFVSSAITLSFDKQGRINIPENLIKYFNKNNQKDVIIIGVINRIEFWALDEWNDFLVQNMQKFNELSEFLFDNN